MELRRFFTVIWQRAWLILLATVLVTGMTFYLSVTSTPIYQATTTIEIDQGADPRNDPYSALRSSEMVASTYVEQMQAPILLKSVIEQLGLPMSVAQLSGGLTVEQVRDTQLIRVSVESSNPLLAQTLANTIARVFIEQEIGRQQARFQAGLQDLEAQIAIVQASIEETQKAIAALGDPLDADSARMPEFARLEMARLESQLTSDQTRLVILLKSAEDFRLAMARYTDYINIFSPAELPTEPVRPRTTLNTILGGISGLVMGISSAFMLEYLDDTIRSPEDVKTALHAGVLGVLPLSRDANAHEAIVAVEQPLSPITEAFRNLRTSIEFSALGQTVRTLLITSPLPTDGKTFIVANLAAVMAQAGKSVIVVDADLRHPMLHRLFDLPQEPGLTSALLDPTDRENALRLTKVDGVRIVTAGPHPHNPSELLSSERMQNFIAWLTESADVVLMDSPPVLAVTDAVVLSAMVEGTVLVVDCGETRKLLASQALERLTDVGARVLGGVLNRFSAGSDGYYYYYDYYSRYYGGGEERGKEHRPAARRRTGPLRLISRIRLDGRPRQRRRRSNAEAH